MDTEGQVAGQCPGSSGPRHHVDVLLVVQGEGDGDGGVLDVLVVLRRLKVGQGRGAARGVGHHPEALVDEPLVPQLAEHPPATTIETYFVHTFFSPKKAWNTVRKQVIY